jgi:hypothetical protein
VPRLREIRGPRDEKLSDRHGSKKRIFSPLMCLEELRGEVDTQAVSSLGIAVEIAMKPPRVGALCVLANL